MCLGLLALIISILNILNIWVIQQHTRSENMKSDINNDILKENEQHLNSHRFKNKLLYVQSIQEKIKKSIHSLSLRYFERNPQYKYELENIINELNINIDDNFNSSIIDKLSNVSPQNYFRSVQQLFLHNKT